MNPQAPAPGAAPAPAAATHWLAVLCAVAAGLAVSLNVGKVPVSLPLLRQELGLSLVQAGWASSMLTTVSVLLAAAAGMWVGRVGALRMVLGGLVLAATASLLAAAGARSFVALLASRFIEGLGFMVVAVACPALVTAAAGPARRRFALGLWSTYMPAGASLAMAASPSLLPLLGWRGLWLMASTVLLLAAAAVWSQRRHYPGSQPVAAPTSFLGPVRQALGQPLPWLLALCFGMWAAQHFALIVWMPTYLLEKRGLPAGQVALLTSVMLVACVPGNLLGGVLVERGLPRGWLLAAAHVGTGLGAVLYSSEGLPDALRYAAAVWVSFIGGLIPAGVMASSTLLARSPQQIGTLQGLYTQGAQLGQFIGTPLIAAVVAAHGQWHSALRVTGAAALIGIGAGLLALRLERRLTSLAR